MRVGEVKNIVGQALNENHELQLNSEDLYSGQAYKINNFASIIGALDILSTQSWNNTDYQSIEGIKSKYGVKSVEVITADEFNQLNSYITTINPQVPLY